MYKKQKDMSENFLIDNHCENVKRLAQLGFEFSEASAFMMFGMMQKIKRTFSITALPIDGIAILREDTADIGSEDFSSDQCYAWNELLDALVRRKAISKKTAMKYK